ncbi:DMT family transporter [Bacillus timonensis]|nr:DMT family transporter [Bacillus timonensis]
MRFKLVADINLLFVAFIWGATFVIVQNAISFLEPLTFNAIRFFFAGFFLFIWLVVFKKDQLKLLNKKLLFSGFIMGTWLFAGYALQTFGLLYTTPSKAGFITGLSVVLVPFFSYFILKIQPNSFALLGVLTAGTGLYLLTMGDSFNVNTGDILVFFCAISFAMHIVFTGKYTSSFPTLLLTVTQIFTVAFLCFISSLFFENWQLAFDPDTILSFDVLFALIITSVFATAIAFLIQTNFQRYTTPTRVALIFAMEPVFAAITAFYFTDERLSYLAIIGCLLILVGMIIAELPQKKRKDTLLAS